MNDNNRPRFFSSLFILIGEIALLNLIFFAWLQWTGTHFVSDDTGLPRLALLFSFSYALCHWAAGISIFHRDFHGPLILRQTLVGNFAFILLFVAQVGIMRSLVLDLGFAIPFLTSQLLASLAYRHLLRRAVKHYYHSTRHGQRTIIIGHNEAIEALVCDLSKGTRYNEQLIGYFSESPLTSQRCTASYLGTIAEGEDYLYAHGESLHRIYCALPNEEGNRIKRMVHFCDNHVVRFVGIPVTYRFLSHRSQTITIDGTPAVMLRPSPLESIEKRLIKRGFDCLCATLFLCTLFPIIYLIFGTWIKLSSPGPIFFKQKRSGLNGEEFWCYKFRSMRVNADSDKLQATANDPRKTRVGDFMRRTNIDELPQLINVWKGEMSLVGPRPHMLKHTEEYRQLIDKYMVRHLVRPGITGWAQVTGFRGETQELWQMEGRVKKDIWYIENWSFSLDLWIMLRTVIKTGEKNAY